MTIPTQRPAAREVADLIFQFNCQEESEYGGVLHCAINELNLDDASLRQTRGWVLEQLEPGWKPPPPPEFDALVPEERHPRGDPKLALAIVDGLLAMKQTARIKACHLGETLFSEVSGLVYKGRGWPETRPGDKPLFSKIQVRKPALTPVPQDRVFRITPLRSEVTFYTLKK